MVKILKDVIETNKEGGGSEHSCRSVNEFFFFFQAEDGIRDYKVTGVQTCALPILLHHRIGDEEIVEALDSRSGQAIWRYSYPSHFEDPYGYNNGPRGSPLLTEDQIGRASCRERV